MRFFCLDFETKDPYLSSAIDLGPGWVYKIHVPTALSFATGYSFCFVEDGVVRESKYLAITDQNIQLLSDLIRDNPNVIMHNAQYDLGYLRSLGININNIKIYDTKIIAQLYDNTMDMYSLDYLSKVYLRTESQKEKFVLAGIVERHKLIKMAPTCKTFQQAAVKFAYENMDIMQEKDFEAMARYANQDTQATANLFVLFTKKLTLEVCNYWSNFQLICTKNREKGLAVDMNVVNSSIELLTPIDAEAHQKVFSAFGAEFNLDSPQQLTEQFLKKGYKLPKTASGGYSTAKDWLESQNDPLCKLVLEYREVHKILRDFFINIRDMQIYTCPEAAHGGAIGRVYPQMDVFGAVTGRFSSSKPNIQQIPKRSKAYGNLCRAMFIPDNPDNNWYSLDWSNQEGRLAVHFASLIKAKGAEEVCKMWTENPSLDMHQRVADMAKIERSQAKAINLGLIYSKGQASLCHELGLPTEMADWGHGPREVAGKEGRALLKKYHAANPWLKDLNDRAKRTIADRGGIITLGGRFVRREHPRFDYKALNKLIQGSAADQMLAALKAADEAGIDIKCIVHDEFCVEGKENAVKMKEIMENVVKLNVPMVAEVKGGKSWGTLEEVKL